MNDFSWNRKYRAVIRCPQCSARYYPVRLDNKALMENGKYQVKCGCGLNYWVKDGKCGLIITRQRKEDEK